jgi:general secretion pathway protein G
MMTEGRRQRTECCRGYAALFQRPARSADKNLSPVFCFDKATSHSAKRAHNARLAAGYLPSERGFTLIELVIVIIIVAVLAGTLLQRVALYQEQAEKAAMVEVAGAIQTALVMQYGRLLARGNEAGTLSLAAENPMNWLAKQPANYSGEFYDPTPRSVAPGNWVFDLKARELVYVVDRAGNFVPGKDGQKWIRYRVNLMRDPAQGVSGKDTQNLAGALFEPAEPYRWL